MADVGKIVKGGLKVAKEIAEGSAARAIGKKPREVPPPFERAPAKSKAEIDEIARRIAPQLTGEFVRLNPKQSVNPVGKSKKRFDYEKTLEHDIRPYTEIIEPENFDYAANQGRVQLGIFGDPTLSQHDIYSVAGRKLSTPSRQFGGPRYAMDKPEEAWASNFGAASGLQAAAKQASQQYGGADVVGLYSKMSQDSYDFAQHVTDTLMKNIMLSLPDMSKKDIAGFNKMVRNNPAAKDFAGIENPDIALAQMEKNPEMRKQFYWRATTPTLTDAFNMPNGLDAVHATIIPELRNLETGITGHTIVELDPDIKYLHPTTRETSTTYDTSIPRKADTEVKKLEALTPIEMSFPDQLLEISKNPRQAGPNAFGTLKGQGARQIIDPQHIDEIGTYRDFIKKYTGKKKGGAVKMADGGKVFKAALKLLKETGEETTEAAAKLPPAENSARTQIVGTIPTYHKARDILKGYGIEGERIIDLGAGKGLGSTIMKAHSMEPYAQGWEPTFTRAADIPSDTYEGLTNLNVLNVVSPEIRRGIVEDIGRVLKPQGGVGLITTRGKDVMNTVGGKPGPEPMSMITSRDTYQKGFTQQELYDYIKDILGDKFEYEKLDLGPAGVKVIKKAKGGAVEDDTDYIQEDPVAYLMNKIKPVKTAIDSPEEFSRRIGKPIPGVNPAIAMLKKGINPVIEALREDVQKIKPSAAIDIPVNTVSEILGAPVDIANELREPVTPIRSDIVSSIKDYKLPPSEALPGSSKAFKKATTDIGLTSGEDYPALQFAAGMVGLPEVKAVGKLAKTGAKAYGNLIKEGIERNIGMFEPRMNIIKDPGGMLVGGEKALDDELASMKKWAPNSPEPTVALNNWVDTKVRKYLRNQAGTEKDPILKAIESGVEHNFQPAMGDTKYYVKNKRASVGKPEEGIAKTELGKEWEYKIDSMFNPKRSEEIRDIVNNPMEFADPSTAKRRKASLLRVEHDLPIQNEADLDALSLINQIPDKHVYTLSGTNITNRLGLNHVSDVLYEDLAAGRLTPQQLDQMSIEKAIRRTAEYDTEKAKAMTKAHATSVEGMPIPKEYNDGYKWVELKHETDPSKTKSALKSEGEMMGHCVGGYCPEVESGEIKIFSLRSPDGKSHVTIEARPQISMTLWRNENMDLISRNPELMKLDFNMRSLDNDDKYGRQMTERDYIRIMTEEMKKRNINPIEPPSYMELHQVKGKQNKRPDEKYQSYISDFIKNNPTKHEIADVYELNNTNLMSVQDIVDTGLVNKKIHFHPDVIKALESTVPNYQKQTPLLKDEYTYGLIKGIAKDFASKGQYYIDNEDIINAAKAMIPPGKKAGGPITKKDLENQMKLDDIVDTPNLRRRYG